MITPSSVYRIGHLGKTHGLEGELSFFFEDDVFDRSNAEYVVLLLDGILVPFFIEDYRFQNGEKALIKFDSIDTLEQAAPLVNADVFFPKSNGSRITYKDRNNDEAKSLLDSLVGFSIYDLSSRSTTAPIVRIDCNTDNPLFELEGGALVPIVEEWIENIDEEKRMINMNLPEGLLAL